MNTLRKIGCLLVLAVPVGFYLLTFYSGASDFEKAGRAASKAIVEEKERTRSARYATPTADERRARDEKEIRTLLARSESLLAGKARAQTGAARAGDCRAVTMNPTQQSDDAAWWSVDFECAIPGNRLPNKTTVSVRLFRDARGWSAVP
jgi:hypothetical protein